MYGQESFPALLGPRLQQPGLLRMCMIRITRIDPE